MQTCAQHITIWMMMILLSVPALADENVIENGTFNRSADGWMNQPGDHTPDVTSMRLRDGGRDRSPCVSIWSRNKSPNMVWAWRYSMQNPSPGRQLHVTGWVKGAQVSGLAAICVQAWNADRSEIIGFATTQGANPLTGSFGWTEITTTLNTPAGAKDVDIMIFLTGTGRVWFDDISAVAGEKALFIAPGLYKARGHFKVGTGASGCEPKFLLPLPLSYREQAPLTYRIWTKPEGTLASARVYEEQRGNFVAEITLRELGPDEPVEIEWISLVLCADRPFEDVPRAATMRGAWPEEALPWLAATRCVEADHERIRAVAKEIRNGESDVMKIISATLKRTAEIYAGQEGRCRELGAVEALEKKGSCTSCANLVAALLRANGIPARILAGYPTWSGPLQTHYIVEAFVPGYGWYPIESTRLEAPWPPYQQIEVSIIRPEQEDRSQPRHFAAGGVPYLSLTESPGADGSYFAMGMVDGKTGCDHSAEPWRNFDEPAHDANWGAALEASRILWQKWLDSQPALLEGELRSSLGMDDVDVETLQALVEMLMQHNIND